eukprot:g6984.t1
MFRLVAVDLFQHDMPGGRYEHILSHPDNLVRRLRERFGGGGGGGGEGEGSGEDEGYASGTAAGRENSLGVVAGASAVAGTVAGASAVAGAAGSAADAGSSPTGAGGGGDPDGPADAQPPGAAPFIFAVNLMLPGPPYMSMVVYFTPREPSLLSDGSDYAELFSDFLDGDDDFRHDRFKLIPSIVKGNWIVKQTVGNTPTIIGRKLRQPYYRGEDYFEVDLDVTSTSVGSAVVKLVSGYTRQLVVDLAFLLEGKCEEELPERLIGVVRLTHWSTLTNLTYVDFANAGMSGTLPASWSALRRIKKMLLNRNEFSGPIPAGFPTPDLEAWSGGGWCDFSINSFEVCDEGFVCAADATGIVRPQPCPPGFACSAQSIKVCENKVSNPQTGKRNAGAGGALVSLGVDCTGGGVKVRDGFYVVGSLEGFVPMGTAVEVIRCRAEGACSTTMRADDFSVRTVCADHTEGVLCGTCAPGYGKVLGRCNECLASPYLELSAAAFLL